MAGGIDWFRWHHGSVTDPKFQLVARKAGARLPDVLAVWAFLLEKASASDQRGTFGDLDAESVDCLFGFEDGLTASIVEQMAARGLVDGSAVAAWEKRQPKREDETAADRKRRQRERDHELRVASVVTDGQTRDVTHGHADVTHGHDRVEERREEYSSPDGDGDKPGAAGFVDPCPHQQIIELYHAALPTGRQVREWTAARATALRTRWRENPKRQTLDWWRRFFDYCAKSPFLTGQVTSAGRKPFEVSLDWLVKSENMAKVIEGAYHEAEREAA